MSDNFSNDARSLREDGPACICWASRERDPKCPAGPGTCHALPMPSLFQDAVNFLTDAQEYLSGTREGAGDEPSPVAALDAIAEAEQAISRVIDE